MIRWSIALALFVSGCSPERNAPEEKPSPGSGSAVLARSEKRTSIPAGRVFGRERTCEMPVEDLPIFQWVDQQVSAFEIDVETVSCAEWTKCVADSLCKQDRRDGCQGGKAVVTASSAGAFCEAAGSRLPSWGEWMRAVRQDRRDVVVPRVGSPCFHPGLKPRPCAMTSALGLQFTLDNPNEGEWTGDTDCVIREEVSVGVQLEGRSIGAPHLIAERMEFRCVTQNEKSKS